MTKIKTKERMVDGAKTLMRRHGYGATSFKDVWEFTNTPRGSVYFHFPDGKQQLGVEVISSTVGTLLSWTTAAEEKSNDAPGFIIELGNEIAGFLVSNDYDEGCPIASVSMEMSPSSELLRNASSAAYSNWAQGVCSVLIDRGQDPETASDTATAAVSAFEGAILVGKSSRDRKPIDLVAQMIAKSFGN